MHVDNLVSVIVPNYNHGKHLSKRIESILAQTYSNIELILLDDNSTDNSLEILNEYRNHPKVKAILSSEKNSGSPFKQWNRGVELADGKYVWIAESDDFAHPEFLMKTVTTLEENTNVGLCYTNSFVVNEKDEIISSLSEQKKQWLGSSKWDNDYQNTGQKEIEENLGYNCTINNASAVLFRKEFLSESVFENFEYNYIGDWYCYLHILKSSSVMYISEKLSYYREHDNFSKTMNKATNNAFLEYFKIHSYIRNEFPAIDTERWKKAFIKGTVNEEGLFSSLTWNLFFEFVNTDFKLSLRWIWIKILISLRILKTNAK